jgi:hypothetical protein
MLCRPVRRPPFSPRWKYFGQHLPAEELAVMQEAMAKVLQDASKAGCRLGTVREPRRGHLPDRGT